MPRHGIKLMVFPLVAVLMLWGFGKILTPKWTDELTPTTLAVTDFYNQPRNSLDVLFLGSCNIYNNVNPVTMYARYGFTSYDLTSPDQEIWASYYYLEEALKYQSPSVVVLDALMIPEVYHAEESYVRQSLDYLRLSPTKLKLAQASLENPDVFSLASVVLPILRYHDRWKALEPEDLSYFSKAQGSIYMGSSPMFAHTAFEGDLDYMAPTEEIADVKEKAVDYLARIQQLCDQRGIRLYLVKTPTALSWNAACMKAVSNVADQLGIPYQDYNMLLDEIGIDWTTDSFTSGGARLNAHGMEKFSRYLGAQLQQQYDLPDRRQDDAIRAHWQDSAARYDRDQRVYALGRQTDFVQYWQEATQLEDCVIVIAVCDDGTEALGEEHLAALRGLGLQADLQDKFTWSYLAVIDDQEVQVEYLTQHAAAFAGTFGDCVEIDAVSVGAGSGQKPTASIRINGDQRSYDHRGMNIAVVDKLNGHIVDVVAFDTYDTMAAIRP